MTTLKYNSSLIDNHNFTDHPVFIRKNGKLIGMIRRSAFNNLYPTATDDNKDFDGLPLTLRLSDVAIFLESKDYELVIE